jgi:hypothetical protein
MLGVGLHSYGFMSGAAFWLGLWILSNLAVMGLGLLPLRMWHSFGAFSPAPVRPPKSPRLQPQT